MNYQPNEIRSDTPAQVHGESLSTVEYGEERKSKLPWIILGILIVGALVAAWYFMGSGSGTATPVADRDEQAPRITVVAPGAGTIQGTISATGTLAARRAMPVGVVGEGGRVVAVPVEQGQWVNAGQVLASIDRSVQSQQARAQAAQIEVARADASLAQSNLDRALQLVERGFISKADIDRLTATRDSARARVSVAQAQLAELRARNARLNIVAPASGLLLERNVEPGQTVSAGSGPLFTIARGGELELMAQVGETDLAQLSTGVQATVIPAGTDKSFAGQIWQLEPTINAQTRQGTARISLPYAPELRPGGFATATIQSGTIVAPMLPESAILADDEGSFVYIIDADNKAQRRSVTTGIVTNSGIAINSGLDGSEKVVLRAGGFLTEGESVSPQMAEAETSTGG
ncbi:efflux RND transporter periplasmic adaptor subunit [Parerythrobacter jejuensis]|uniref:Efflux RND transporter periplasmic adaptor subunit n=1 Tax=Parerythrobacter jejuensis TaxID=795812 RepID=A0A845AVL3_9SPHN|nr:efflux RND transporter periplasmic adaptor subunit [Parerythrobacter jejuensis]MXP30854.1 efflux RND transporter periplasmic adaptor subunit [Parerythrobacter jejuensis]MXP33614.1 efflux RND transporter periplasmic adaptor subunit [Parerythrobacter jejuensis]